MRRGTSIMWGPVAHNVAVGPLILQLDVSLYNSAQARVWGPTGGGGVAVK